MSEENTTKKVDAKGGDAVPAIKDAPEEKFDLVGHICLYFALHQFCNVNV